MDGNRAARRAAGWRGKKSGTVQYGQPKYPDTASNVPKVISPTYDTRIVFRVEHSVSGKGPFTHGHDKGIWASDAMRYMEEPTDFPGVKAHVGSRHWYAFTDAKTMLHNIDRFVILRELDFLFSVYESKEHLVFPDGQVAFVMSKATKLKSYNVANFPFEEYC